MFNAFCPVRFRALPFLVALLGALAAGQPPAEAQTTSPIGKLKSQHGAWAIVCDTPAGATNEQCLLRQIVVPEDRPEIGLAISVLKTADGKDTILRVRAPLGIILPSGLQLNVDGKLIGRAQFVRCFADGCLADVIMDQSLIDTLSNAKSATFSFFQSPEQGIGIPVELDGFKDGFAALP